MIFRITGFFQWTSVTSPGNLLGALGRTSIFTEFGNELTEGWTAPLDFSLLSNRDTPAGSLSGMTIVAFLRDRDGNEIDTAGEFSVQDGPGWVVRWSPGSGKVKRGTFRLRVRVTDSAGKSAFFPSGQGEKFRVWGAE